MPEKQGSLALLDDPLSQELLHAPLMAHLAYVAPDGTPRIMPIWFTWEYEEVVFCSVSVALKLKSLKDGTKVSVDIDRPSWPYPRLLIRGTVSTTEFVGIVPGYRETAIRYIGEQYGNMFIGAMESMKMHMVRIAVKPHWVGLYDFESRMPGQS
jgi:Pyridoxamine 5'-phosphate oxidase